MKGKPSREVVIGVGKVALIALVTLALCPLAVSARALGQLQGHIEQTGQPPKKSSLSTNTRGTSLETNALAQPSRPHTLVTVFKAGTQTLAKIASDSAGTQKDNPFSADSLGYWFFFGADGEYDVEFSGGGITTPYTFSGLRIVTSGGEYANLKYFGAACNGTSDDTAAFNLAVSSGAGTIYIPGNSGGCKFAKPVTLTSGRRYLIEGKLILGGALATGSSGLIDVVGVGSSTSPGSSQFQIGRPGQITCPANGDCIRVNNSAGTLLKDLYVVAGNGRAIFADGSSSLGALLRIDNVGVLSSSKTGPRAVPLEINSFFWVWAKHCRFLQGTGNAPYSVHITNSKGAPGASGIVFLDDVIVNGYGILIDSEADVPNFGNFHWSNGAIESSQASPLLSIDTTNLINATTGDIEVSNVFMADDIASPESVVKITGRKILTKVTLSHITVGAPSTFINDCALIRPVIVGGYDGRVLCGTGQFIGQFIGSNGSVVADDYNRDFGSLPVYPVQPSSLTQNLAEWVDAASATVTSGQIAPDGSTTAYRLTSGAGIGQRNIHATVTYERNAWIIAGFYGSFDSGAPSGFSPVITLPSGDQFSNGSRSHVLAKRGIVDGKYCLFLVADKITTLGTTGTGQNIAFGISVDPAHPGTVAWPFLVVVPAGIYSDQQIADFITQRYRGWVTRGCPVGTLCMQPHQQISFNGGDTFANLGSPPNGTIKFCSDCKKVTPCAAGGGGAFAKRAIGAWDCN